MKYDIGKMALTNITFVGMWLFSGIIT
jgi:hypothetical protein